MSYNSKFKIIEFESAMRKILSDNVFDNICDSTELKFRYNERMDIFYIRYFDKCHNIFSENLDSLYMGAIIQYKNRYVHLKNVNELCHFITAERDDNDVVNFLSNLHWYEKYSNRFHYISSLDLDLMEYYIRPSEIEFYIDPYKNKINERLFNCDSLAQDLVQKFYKHIFIPLVNGSRLRIGTSLHGRNSSIKPSNFKEVDYAGRNTCR